MQRCSAEGPAAAGRALVAVLLLAGGLAAGCTAGGGPEPTTAGGGGGGLPALRGPYLGQEPPGDEPRLFAPGFISTGLFERDLAVSPDGREVYYGLAAGDIVTVMVTRLRDGVWTEPEVASFAADLRYRTFEPALAADGGRILFLSTRPPAGQDARPGWGHQNIWAADRLEDGSWGEPYDLGEPVNTDANEYYPSLTADGTLIFSRSAADEPFKPALYRARPQAGGGYGEPERLPEAVNGDGHPYNAFVAADESYLIACVVGRSGSASPEVAEYCVFFRDGDGAWSEGTPLGPAINRPGVAAGSASVSPDGRFLFFASSRTPDLASGEGVPTLSTFLSLQGSPENGRSDIYWVDAAVIDRLRRDGAAASPTVAE